MAHGKQFLLALKNPIAAEQPENAKQQAVAVVVHIQAGQIQKVAQKLLGLAIARALKRRIVKP